MVDQNISLDIRSVNEIRYLVVHLLFKSENILVSNNMLNRNKHPIRKLVFDKL